MDKRFYPAQGKLPEFELIRKSIKKIYLRIDDGGRVQITAPAKATLAEVRAMIERNLGWIEQAQQRRAQLTASRCRLADGGAMLICGRECPVRVVQGGRPGCAYEQGMVTVTVRDPGDEASIAAAAESFLRQTAWVLFEDSLERMYPLVKGMGAMQPTLKIRRMTSRWGTCNVRTGQITLNLCLARAPMELIDSVVLHELIHLLNPPHDERFHAISASLMPDYKIRRKRLNALDIIY